MAGVLQLLQQARAEDRTLLGVLIDPDHAADKDLLERTVQHACMAKADVILVGGSLLTSDGFDACVKRVKELSDRPVVLFPGSPAQLSGHADALLFLSLISGRNPELLIGHHVTSAPTVKAMGLEAIPTGYLLVDGGRMTTAHYVSQTSPTPHDNPAGELLGLKAIYLDAGSDAPRTVAPDMVKAVRQAVDLPIIVGGGIRSTEQAQALCEAGADMLVVGTAFEEDPERVFALREAVTLARR